MSYVRNPLGQAIEVPAGILVENEGDGILAVVTAESFSDDDPAHVARANALNEALVVARSRQGAHLLRCWRADDLRAAANLTSGATQNSGKQPRRAVGHR